MQSVFLEDIRPADYIIAYGTQKNYICYTVPELIDLLRSNQSEALSMEALHDLSRLSYHGTYPGQSDLQDGIRAKLMQSRADKLARVIRPLNPETQTAILKIFLDIRNLCLIVFKADKMFHSKNIKRAFTDMSELLAQLPPAVNERLITAGGNSLSGIVQDVLHGLVDTFNAARNIYDTLGYYNRWVFNVQFK